MYFFRIQNELNEIKSNNRHFSLIFEKSFPYNLTKTNKKLSFDVEKDPDIISWLSDLCPCFPVNSKKVTKSHCKIQILLHFYNVFFLPRFQ